MIIIEITLPVQVLLSAFNAKPRLHEHMKLPLVLVQFWAHPPLLVRHSFISGKISVIFETIVDILNFDSPEHVLLSAFNE